MSKKAASRVRRIPLADADIGKLARRMHQNGEYFIVEDRGVPMVGLMDAEEMEDYLELRDPAVRRAIRKSTREYMKGQSRPADVFLGELKRRVTGSRKSKNPMRA